MDVAYFTSAAQRPDKQIKFDFFYIHGLNSTIFLSKIIRLPYLDDVTKARILEWTGRLDLLLYVAYGAADLHLDEITRYSAAKSWEEIYSYCNGQSSDDGHLPKLVRALKNGERACRPFEDRAEELGLKIKGDMWLKIANMGMFILNLSYGCDRVTNRLPSDGFDWPGSPVGPRSGF